MSSMLLESGGNGRYYLSIDFFDDEKQYINSEEELKERMTACIDICNKVKETLENTKTKEC